ncbi:zinc-dependent alcohol dehydrogenase family protein [Sorangium sp. So ce1024]|uniref:zinc-dependent alcohol dehydrogenase family protein n=1 Tax=Sorangium sp. So ce1024 TaxID=3133327 RepID=UPI003F0BCAF3
MKAVIIRKNASDIDAWTLAERPAPTPGPGEVLVRVRAASINYRDLMIARGLFGGDRKDDLVPLADAAGEVVALGAGVRRWKAGDRVLSTYFPTWASGPFREEYRDTAPGAGRNDGVLAELVVFAEDALVRAPAHLGFDEAATLPCAAVTAWTALFESWPRPAPGATVLVQGTGGVSLFAAQLARAAGLRVIATSSSAAKIERLRALGVTDAIDYRQHPEWHEEVLRLTRGEGVDRVIEVGGAGTLPRSLQAVRPGGVVSLIGVLAGIGDQIDPMPILLRAVRVEGVMVGSRQSFIDLLSTLEAHAIRPVLDEVFPLERASDALARLAAGKHFGKIVIRLD